MNKSSGCITAYPTRAAWNGKGVAWSMQRKSHLLRSAHSEFPARMKCKPVQFANTPTDYDTKCGLLEDTYAVLDIEKILTGSEEQVGGYDLICKGNPVKPSQSSMYSSHLGCFNNRNQQLKKLAKMTAARLAQNYQ